MTIAAEDARARALTSAKDRPARELVVALFFGPLALWLARTLVPLRVQPPAVVLANAAAGLASAFLLLRGEPVAAAVVLQLKTLLDNADGRLARLSGRATRLGRFLDTEVDVLVNAALFAAFGRVTGEPWLALAGFLALTIVLSVSFNAAEASRAAHGRPTALPPPNGGAFERAAEGTYRLVFAPQDRALRAFLARRRSRLLEDEHDAKTRRRAILAYHDSTTMAILANIGLSTQLAVFGLCLALGVLALYPWLALGCLALLPLLQLRREWLVRRALSGRRAA